jgi:hypothetical protein
LPSTISAPVTARIHYDDVDALRCLAARDGHTVSSLVARMVHDGLQRRELDALAQQRRTVAASSA